MSRGNLCPRVLCPGESVSRGVCPGGSLSMGLCPGKGSLSWGISVLGDLCPGGVFVQESVSRGSLSKGVSLKVKSLSMGSLSRGSLSKRVSVQGVPVQGVSVQGDLSPRGLCSGVSVQGGLCPGRGSLVRGSLSREVVSVQGGGLYPGRGALALESLCRGSLSRGVSVREIPPLPYGNVRAVRILLECLLVRKERKLSFIFTVKTGRRLHAKFTLAWVPLLSSSERVVHVIFVAVDFASVSTLVVNSQGVSP